MSLKSLINALFKLSGGQAMPKSQWTDLDTESSSIIAPSNGYLKLSIHTDNANSPWFNASVNNCLSVNWNAVDFVGGFSSCFVPMKKGDTVSLMKSNCTFVSVQFFPLVGGGLRAFCRKLFSVFGEVQYA